MDPPSEPTDIESGVGDVTAPERGKPTMVRGSMTAGRRGAGFTLAGRSAGRGTSCVIRGSRSAGRSIRGGRSVGIDIDLNAQGREDDEPIEVEAEITANNSVSNFLTHGHC
jgi:hypothetical protein